jgi:dihydroorotate dehydrogenase electron transfer subunit
MPVCEVVRSEAVAPGHTLLVLHCPRIAQSAVPGQFVHVRVSETLDPLLRRPLSILLADPRRQQFQVLVRSVGRGSELLSHVVPGNRLDVLGPLGRGFTLVRPGQEPLLVAGGVGVAPLIFLADVLQRSEGGHYVRALFGARSEDTLVCWQELAARCEEFQAATEDGSVGTQGLVTDLLQEQLDRAKPAMVYTCGPRPMMARVAQMCDAVGVPCEASLEQFMGCGIGACLGCAVPSRAEPGSYVRVCTDGPVFDATQIAWEALTD